jgi:hypothetical protein
MDAQDFIYAPCASTSHMHWICLKKEHGTTATVSHAKLDRVLSVPLYPVMHELRRHVFYQKRLQLLAQELGRSTK